MKKTLLTLVQEELCPNGVWQLRDTMESVLRCQMSKLPKRDVSEDESRYPVTREGMRVFLDTFFARHYFQTQNSLIDYMTSIEFLNQLVSGKLQILDVGCGPSVASLAITDMLDSILRNLVEIDGWPKNKIVKIHYVLNDTSSICLGTGQDILADYFRRIKRYNSGGIFQGYTVTIQKAFPNNISQLRRISLNIGRYDIATFSYVIVPLIEKEGFTELVKGLFNIQSLCSDNGRILILQDKFQEQVVKKLSKATGIPMHREELKQYIYSSKNENETYAYSYFAGVYPLSGVTAERTATA